MSLLRSNNDNEESDFFCSSFKCQVGEFSQFPNLEVKKNMIVLWCVEHQKVNSVTVVLHVTYTDLHSTILPIVDSTIRRFVHLHSKT